MANAGQILLADDDETFTYAAAELLRRDGYDCETVADGASALARTRERPFDLLITDLEMPGNSNLQLVRDIASEGRGLPVIILTGHPSVQSAMACIELPVAAYLSKPIDFPLLSQKVRAAVSRFRSYQMMQSTESRLKSYREEFANTAAALPAAGGSPVDVFLALTLRNVMGSLTDLEQLGKALSAQPVEAHPCQLLNCPRGAQLHEAVTTTIRVLEETKSSFKSKTLADLRQQLELLLEHN
jgi:CheY-like chemotaxis protein